MKGKNKYGNQSYRNICEIHRRPERYAVTIDNSVCERCGWDKTPNDRHRIGPSRLYTPDNVIVLCPNCHRLQHQNQPTPVLKEPKDTLTAVSGKIEKACKHGFPPAFCRFAKPGKPCK